MLDFYADHARPIDDETYWSESYKCLASQYLGKARHMRKVYHHLKPKPVDEVLEDWIAWAGETAWTKALREFGASGGLIVYWCGMPQCASAIPLAFTLHRPDGSRLPCDNRLKDIRAAIKILKQS